MSVSDPVLQYLAQWGPTWVCTVRWFMWAAERKQYAFTFCGCFCLLSTFGAWAYPARCCVLPICLRLRLRATYFRVLSCRAVRVGCVIQPFFALAHACLRASCSSVFDQAAEAGSERNLRQRKHHLQSSRLHESDSGLTLPAPGRASGAGSDHLNQ
jgi:hypothetical protein